MKILALETSCDETACAVVEDGVKEIASVVSSSAKLHEKTGGIVPEVAARKQVESIVPVIDECLKIANIVNPAKEIDALAVTVGPGLIGSLLVGVAGAKSLSLAWDKPLIPVNHLVGHIYGAFLTEDQSDLIKFPAVVLIVSGGHTDLIVMRGHGKLEYLGGTLDDAAGEAFDKVARLLGLSRYLGGPLLSAEAAKCQRNTLSGKLPRPMMDREDFDFSFSGLKTAVIRLVEKEKPPIAEVAREFEEAATEVLVKKTIRAALKTGAASIVLGGGVAANQRLRSTLAAAADKNKLPIFFPALKYCGDNAAYIASAAYFNNRPQPLNLITAEPSLSIMEL